MKHNLNKNKNKNNNIVTAVVIAFLTLTGPLVLLIPISQSAEATTLDPIALRKSETRAPAVVSGDNIYIAWWTNNTENGNEEVMFRASTDGATFSDKINLSNTTDADSWRVEIAGEGETVVVSWWETNQTSDIPVARISTDAGETFGELIMLGTNGTIGVTEEEGAATAEGEGEEGEVEGEVEEAEAGGNIPID